MGKPACTWLIKSSCKLQIHSLSRYLGVSQHQTIPLCAVYNVHNSNPPLATILMLHCFCQQLIKLLRGHVACTLQCKWQHPNAAAGDTGLLLYDMWSNTFMWIISTSHSGHARYLRWRNRENMVTWESVTCYISKCRWLAAIRAAERIGGAQGKYQMWVP